jgi:type I restriction enzyme S subunit
LYHMYKEVINEVVNRTNLNKSELTFSQGDEILLPSAGEDPLDIGSASALMIENVAIGRTINILRPLKPNIYYQIFASYYINHKLKKDISKLAKGVSISNVYNSDLKTLSINLPTLPEQTKIANFLTAVDDKLTQLKKKKSLLEQYKKGVMQKIFSQELRFKEENGEDFAEWEEKKLGEIVDINKGEQLNKEELTEIGEFPCINGGISPSGFTDKFNSNENTIVMSEGGASCGYLKMMDTKFWSGGHCYTLNIKNKQSTNTDYLFQLLKSNEIEIMRLRVGSGLPNIQKKDILVFEINYSKSIIEQTKIANFLSAIDDKISHCGVQIEKMEGWKKGLLQGMFV